MRSLLAEQKGRFGVRQRLGARRTRADFRRCGAQKRFAGAWGHAADCDVRASDERRRPRSLGAAGRRRAGRARARPARAGAGTGRGLAAHGVRETGAGRTQGPRTGRPRQACGARREMLPYEGLVAPDPGPRTPLESYDRKHHGQKRVRFYKFLGLGRPEGLWRLVAFRKTAGQRGAAGGVCKAFRKEMQNRLRFCP